MRFLLAGSSPAATELGLGVEGTDLLALAGVDGDWALTAGLGAGTAGLTAGLGASLTAGLGAGLTAGLTACSSAGTGLGAGLLTAFAPGGGLTAFGADTAALDAGAAGLDAGAAGLGAGLGACSGGALDPLFDMAVGWADLLALGPDLRCRSRFGFLRRFTVSISFDFVPFRFIA